MWSRIAAICSLILLLTSCGFDYKADISLRGNAIGGSLGLEIAGNPTSVEVTEGSSLVIVPALTGTSTEDIQITLTVNSPRNDVGAFFTQTFPITSTIPAGSSSTTVTLNTVHDVTYTGDLPFVIVVSSPSISGSVILNLTLKDQEPLVLGSFAIDGIEDADESTDTSPDALLLDAQTPKVSWDSSSHAVSYDVSILEDDGTTVRCAVQNTTQTSYKFSSGSCFLNFGSFYRAKVTAKNGSVTEDAALYRFEVKSSAVLTSDTILMAIADGPVTFDPRANDLDTGTTITAVSTPSRGTTSFSGTSVTYTRGNTVPGLVTFTYTTLDGSGNSRNGTVTVKIMAPYSWTGAISNDFATAGNWCGTVSNPGVSGSCDGQTVAPGSSSNTYVDLTCSSSHCDPVISANTTVKGITLSGNSLTVNGSATLTVRTTGLTQSGGTFTAGTGEVFFDDGKLTLTGGTFTAPNGNLKMYRQDITIDNGVVFNHNNGTLRIDTAWDRAVKVTSNSAVWNNVIFNPNSSTFRAEVSGDMNVDGNITLNHNETGSTYNSLEGGVIKLKGNLTTNDNGLKGNTVIELMGNVSGQTVTGTGTQGSYVPGLKISAGTNPVTLSGKVKVSGGLFNMVSSGTFVATGSTLMLGDADCGTKQYTFGNVHYGSLEFSEGCQGYDFNNGTVKIDGDVIVNNKDYYTGLSNATLEIKGNILAVGAYGIGESNSTMKLIGNPAGQTITSDRTTMLGGILIDTGSYDVSMVGEAYVIDFFRINSVGTFTAPSELILDSGCYGYGSDGFQAKLNNQTFPYLRLEGGCPYFDFVSDTATVGNLIVAGGYNGDLDNGTLNVTGDLTLENQYGFDGSLTIALKGNASGQTISPTGAESYIPRLTIDTGSYPVTVAGSASLMVVNRYEHISSGTMSFSSYPLVLGKDDCVGDITATMGPVLYNNVTVNTFCHDSYFTDSVSIGGDLTFSGAYGSGVVHMPNPGTGYSLTVGGAFNRNGVTLNAYGATVPP